MIIFQIAQDEWQENKHPRAPDGKFGTGSGGGGGSSSEGGSSSHAEGTHLSNKVKKALIDHGYKKVSSGKTEGGTTTYYHGPSKTKVIIHPEEGKKHSSKWSLQKESGGAWPSWSGAGEGGGSPEKSSKSLADLLGKIAGAPKQPTSQNIPITETPAAAAQPTALNSGETALVLSGKGFKPSGNSAEPSGYAIYKKDPGMGLGAKVAIKDDGNWIVSTPGFSQKTGSGTANLDALLSGKPAVIPPGGKAPWSVTSATFPKTAAEQADYAKAVAAEQEEQKKQAAEQNAHKNIYKDLQSAAPTPSEKQKAALSHYGGSGYKSLNGSLRSNHTTTAQSESIKELDAFLAKSEIPQDVTLYRGVKGEYASILKSVVMEGTKFIDRGFISTSAQQSTGTAFASGLTMKINVKKGSKGAAIGNWSGHQSEYEVLLPRNSALVVKSYDPHTGHIECDLDQGHL